MVKNISGNTYKHLQLNAGAMLYDIDLDEIENVEELRDLLLEYLKDGKNFLGATRGGARFRALPSFQKYRVDGKPFDNIGAKVVDNWDVRFDTVLLEFTPESLLRLTSSSTMDRSFYDSKLLNLNNHSKVDYFKNIIWVGDWANHGLIAIELKNVVNQSGIDISISENGEGFLSAAFVPHQGGYFDRNTPPFNIYFFTDIDKL